jgi:hypothetical protein
MNEQQEATREIEPIMLDRLREYSQEHNCSITVEDGRIVFKKRSSFWTFIKEFFDGKRN